MGQPWHGPHAPYGRVTIRGLMGSKTSEGQVMGQPWHGPHAPYGRVTGTGDRMKVPFQDPILNHNVSYGKASLTTGVVGGGESCL